MSKYHSMTATKPRQTTSFTAPVPCRNWHDGNRELHPTARGMYECAGCGTVYRPAEIEEMAAAKAKRDERQPWQL